jgi:hypothetical protein
VSIDATKCDPYQMGKHATTLPMCSKCPVLAVHCWKKLSECTFELLRNLRSPGLEVEGKTCKTREKPIAYCGKCGGYAFNTRIPSRHRLKLGIQGWARPNFQSRFW